MCLSPTLLKEADCVCLSVPAMVLQGSRLRKYGRRGKPKEHFFYLTHDERWELQWQSSNVGACCLQMLSLGPSLEGLIAGVAV